MNVQVIETHEQDSVEWGISFGGSNPLADDYFKMPDMETAFRLRQRLLAEAAPIPGNKPVGLPCDKLGGDE